MHPRTCPTCHGEVDPASGVCPRCDTTVQSAARTVPADVKVESAPPEFPGYRVLQHLGEGGMGAVYLAEDSALARKVAIKVVSSRVASDAQSRSRFLREARTLATIEHPHVVRVYSFGDQGGHAYLVMEYVEGETLADRIARGGRMSVSEALRMTRQIVDALEAAWERRIIHRDIKPSNILLDRRNQVRVADFGLAKPVHIDRIDSSLTQSGYMLGTPHYVSPEQAQGKEVDFRADMYSCGIMLYQMLTGERPFEGTTPVAIVAKHLHDPIPSLRQKRSDVPLNVERLIAWMTAKDPEQRPSSHLELLEALDALLTSPARAIPTIPAAVASEASTIVPHGTGAARGVWKIAVPLVAVVMAIAGYVLWTRNSKKSEPAAAADSRLVVAVAPFYGPDDDSAKEGRVMAALVERAIDQRLGRENARVIGIDETKTPLRDHDAARELGGKLHANAVIWGEAFALRQETEIQPHVTIVRAAQQKKEATADARDSRLLSTSGDPLSRLEEKSGSTVKLQAEAPNQIELRKTSASGIGDVVLTLAGIHALETQHDPKKALVFFGQAPRSAETLRYRARALLQLNRNDDARATLEESLALEPNDAQTLATLGDLYHAANRFDDAVSAYRKAAALGQPFTSTRGFVDHDRLYVKETYRSEEYTSGEEYDTLYLLGIDPQTRRVLVRHSLPGMVTRFSRNGDAVTITYKTHRSDSPEEADIVFRDGKFDRPLWLTPNLLWRTRSLRAGRVISANFLSQFGVRTPEDKHVARFEPSPKPKPDAPSTLADLERELRAAADRDPTQPAHLFFLALALREQHRTAEAEAVLKEMLRRDYPATPYYEFGWMMSLLERMKAYAWCDAVYGKAIAQRNRLPHMIGGTTLIERLINANWVRHSAMNHDMAHQWQGLDYARNLTGYVLEGDELAAAAWAKHFRDRGDIPRAQREEAVVRDVRSQPLNFLGAGYAVDYSLTVTVAAAFAFLIVLLTKLSSASAKARTVSAERRPLFSRVRDQLGNFPRLGLIITLTLAFAGAALLIGNMWAHDLLGESAFVLLLLALIVVLLRFIRVRPVEVIAAIPWHDRAIVAVAWLILLALGTTTLLALARLGMVGAVPIGFNDGIGQAHIVSEFEKHLNEDPNNLDVIYATAVANHYAGNRERAAALYSRLGPDPRATKNAAALNRGEMPVAKPTLREIGSALAAIPMKFAPPAEYFGVSPAVAIGVIAAIVFSLVPLVLFALIKPRPPAESEPPRRSLFWKIAMWIVPGLYDLREGNTFAGYAAAFAIGLIPLPIHAMLKMPAWSPAASPLGILILPNVMSAFPLPDNFSPLAMRLAPRFATFFWSVFVIAVVVAVAVHLSAIVRMLKRNRG